VQSVDNKPTFLYVTLLRLHSRLLQGRIALLSMHCTLPSRKSCGCRFSALTEIRYQLVADKLGSVFEGRRLLRGRTARHHYFACTIISRSSLYRELDELLRDKVEGAWFEVVLPLLSFLYAHTHLLLQLA